MDEIVFSSDMTVELLGWSGSDHMIASAARVSTGVHDVDDSRDAGLINYLVAQRHGSPFEHNVMNFYVEAPIFVFREFQRHRVGFSYNEMSARYTKLEPKFYIYPEGRPLFQSGSSAHPNLSGGGTYQTMLTNGSLRSAYLASWRVYDQLTSGAFMDPVANEVARSVLPVGIYSKMYVTCNARSMMNFLSLRVDSPDAKQETKPQYEIQVVAEKMEQEFAKLFPLTYDSYIKNGRVSP